MYLLFLILTSTGLSLSTESTLMNTRVTFTCTNGNDLIGGPVEATCLPSGLWSSPIPACQNITCPDIITPKGSELNVRMSGRDPGGTITRGTKAYFSCIPGFYLEGSPSSEATCSRHGNWSLNPSPNASPCLALPLKTQSKRFFYVGDMVKFRCKAGYMMEGQPVLRCGESGQWSNTDPTCVRACTYPGSVIGGTISDVKFFYKVGDTGLVLKGAKMLECLGAGVWSSSMPNCSPPDAGSEQS
ncbi:Uncharacterized protein FKW44_017976 [Caligus rogercresseyi]|uniref:Sushi domain-containing protein n=1 Tax=Caligus rogercresseyi TaxID=217165 RepID=A0A7T8GTS4_CALRO|nr:Uncharacterized protein FKW44_017976 [Caligus rogercresseyi]